MTYEAAPIGEPSRCRTSRFPLSFAALRGRSGHGFAYRVSLSTFGVPLSAF